MIENEGKNEKKELPGTFNILLEQCKLSERVSETLPFGLASPSA
jgi:hypothetical protein